MGFQKIGILTVVAALLAIGSLEVVGVKVLEMQVDSKVYQLYSKWCLKYGEIRNSPSENNFRLKQFNQSYKKIRELREAQPGAEFGLNSLSTLSDKEFLAKSKNANLKQQAPSENLNDNPGYFSGAINALKSLSNTIYGTKVELQKSEKFDLPNQQPPGNQEACNASWAFTAKYVLEDLLQGSINISVQHLLNCYSLRKRPEEFCDGEGTANEAIEVALVIGYRPTSEIPYSQVKEECISEGNSYYPAGYLSQMYLLKENKQVKDTVLKTGAGLSFGVKVSSALRYYTGGILDSQNELSECNEQPDHQIYLTGWGEGYWRLKNSWGESYGMGGYVHISMEKESLTGHKNSCICGSRHDETEIYGCMFDGIYKARGY